MRLRVVELFAGIGAQHAALTRLGIEAECTVCEIDRRAYEAYCAVHGPAPNLGDIRAVERLPPSDLVTWSFPCTSLSIAGSMEGMDRGSGTESSLGWEVLRVLRATPERERPRHLLMENVPMLLSRRYRDQFDAMCAELRSLGYTNSHAVLNATDFGVPQSRKRVFMVSSKDGVMTFPEPRPLTRCLRDVMESDVDPSYFLSAEAIAGYQRHKKRNDDAGRGFGWRPVAAAGVGRCVTPDPTRNSSTFIRYTGDTHKESTFESNRRVVSSEGVSPTLTHRQDEGQCTKIEHRWPVSESYAGQDAGHLDTAFKNRCHVSDPDRIVNSLTTGADNQVENAPREDVASVEVDGERVSIRRLTERECWRLMGFTDEEFDRARDAGTPKTHLYRQAGNSIVVDVLVAIFDAMLVRHAFTRPRAEQSSLDAWGVEA